MWRVGLAVWPWELGLSIEIGSPSWDELVVFRCVAASVSHTVLEVNKRDGFVQSQSRKLFWLHIVSGFPIPLHPGTRTGSIHLYRVASAFAHPVTTKAIRHNLPPATRRCTSAADSFFPDFPPLCLRRAPRPQSRPPISRVFESPSAIPSLDRGAS